LIQCARVAIYARVSTTGQNCELQLTELGEFCLARKWESVGEYVDQGISGTPTSRPERDRLMRDAEARAIDTVVVWKLDRWGRRLLDLAETVEQLRRWKVRWVATTQMLDTDENSSISRLLMMILGAVAEFERAIIQERCAAGQRVYRQAFERGRVGKNKDRQSKSGLNRAVGRPRCVVDRYKVRELRAAGLSLRAIGSKLGVSHLTIKRLLLADFS